MSLVIISDIWLETLSYFRLNVFKVIHLSNISFINASIRTTWKMAILRKKHELKKLRPTINGVRFDSGWNGM